jgi:peroxiredoxin
LSRLFAAVLLSALAAAPQAQPLEPWGAGPTPALELSDAEGGSHRLADYRGRVVLVNFWATWCAPCREEMPSIERLRRALGGRPFAVLAVNVGESARVARDFGASMALGFPLLLDRDTRITKAWGARILPATFVIGPDGAIRYRYFGELDWARDDVRAAVEKLMPR